MDARIPTSAYLDSIRNRAGVLASTAGDRAGSEMDSFKRADTGKEAYRSNAEALALATDIGLGLGTALVGVGVTMLILEGTENNTGL